MFYHLAISPACKEHVLSIRSAFNLWPTCHYLFCISSKSESLRHRGQPRNAQVFFKLNAQIYQPHGLWIPFSLQDGATNNKVLPQEAGAVFCRLFMQLFRCCSLSIGKGRSLKSFSIQVCEVYFSSGKICIFVVNFHTTTDRQCNW